MQSLDKIKISGYLFLLYCLMVASFLWIIHPIYEYNGFIKAVSFSSFVIGSLFLLISFLFINLIKDKFLFYIGVLILVFFTIPYSIIFQFVYPNYNILLAQFVLIIVYYFVSITNFKIPVVVPKVPKLKFSYLLLFTTVSLVPFVWLYYDNINMKLLWFDDVYSARLAFQAKSNIFTGYMFSWSARVMLPILLAYSIKTKKTGLLVLAFLALVFLYLISGHKSVFIGSGVVILFYYGTYYQKILSFLRILILVLFVGLIAFFLFDHLYISSLAARRALLLPALINEYYFQFYHDNHLYWSDSFFSFFIDYPFDLSPPYLIGDKYFGSELFGANNGLISDGFMNAGMFGVIFNSIVFSIIIKYFAKLDLDSIYFGLFFLLMISFMSSFLTVVMLTHGGLFLMIVIRFFNLKE